MDRETQKGLFRTAALIIGIGGLGLITWIGTIPKGIDRGAGYVESTGASSAQYQSGSTPVIYRDVKGGSQPCSSFEDSPYAVEAMIGEMVDRGWKPPTQREALASTQPARGAPIKAVDPDAPVPVAPPRQSTPAPVDATAPPSNADAVPQDPGAVPVQPAPAQPAPVQPAPAQPAPKPPTTSLPG